MSKYIVFSNIMMSCLIALSTYGILWGYFHEGKLMWSAIFTILFAIRIVTKDNLKVGFSRYSLEFDKLIASEKFLYYLQGGLSFSFYVGAFIIAINKLIYDPSVIFLTLLAIMTTSVDIYSFFRKKEMFMDG